MAGCVSEWPFTEFNDNYGIPELWGTEVWKPWGQEFDLRAIHSKCNFSNSSLYGGLGAMAALSWYPDQAAYASWRGHDLVPWWSLTPFRKAWPVFVASLDQQDVVSQYCVVGEWHVQRVGPFRSRGGYDWWQIAGRDFSRISEALESTSDGVFLTTHFLGPVNENGHSLSYPPIHMHHFHINPSRWFVRYRFPDFLCMFGYCYSPNVALEQHGDFVCDGQGQGSESDNCYFERAPPGYGKKLTTALDLEGEMNDVRPAGSEPLEWWLELAVRLERSPTKLKPLSSFYILSPGTFNIFNQFGYSFLFPEPTDELSLLWYTGSTPRAGHLVRNKPHLHMTLVEESLFFAARPDQLGIDGDRFHPSRPWAVVPLSQTGFSNFSDIHHYLHRNILAARQVSLSVGVAQDGLKPPHPRLICRAKRGLGRENGLYFDRRGQTFCRPWHFADGDIFTVVTFLRQTASPEARKPDAQPRTLPMHVHWFFQYEAAPTANDVPESYFEMAMHCQDVRWQSKPFMFFPGPHLILFIAWGGMPCNTYLHPLIYFVLFLLLFNIVSRCCNMILRYLRAKYQIASLDLRVCLVLNVVAVGMSTFLGFDGLALLAFVNCILTLMYKLVICFLYQAFAFYDYIRFGGRSRQDSTCKPSDLSELDDDNIYGKPACAT